MYIHNMGVCVCVCVCVCVYTDRLHQANLNKFLRRNIERVLTDTTFSKRNSRQISHSVE